MRLATTLEYNTPHFKCRRRKDHTLRSPAGADQWAMCMCSLVSSVPGVTDGWAGLLHTHQPIHTSCCLVIVVCYINTFIHNMVQIDFMVSDIYGVRKS